MTSPDTTRRLWSLGLFALPLVAVKLAAIMLGGSSQRAGAAAQPAAVEPASATAASTAGATKVVWTSAQRSAADHVIELAGSTFGPSPMLQPKPPPPPVPAPVPVEVPVIIPDEPDPVFLLHAVMVTANTNKAVINGRTYEIGQRIEEGAWVVDQIDVDERSATLRNVETQSIMVISVQAPD